MDFYDMGAFAIWGAIAIITVIGYVVSSRNADQLSRRPGSDAMRPDTMRSDAMRSDRAMGGDTRTGRTGVDAV